MYTWVWIGPAGSLVILVGLTGEVTPKSLLSTKLAKVVPVERAPLITLVDLVSPLVSTICLALSMKPPELVTTVEVFNGLVVVWVVTTVVLTGEL